ncbi:DHHC palmitoyltransferase family protein [Cryptosporidium meleagridis]|uniref:DHHC palmitoyltransferase family protein n=1 Tax=Cryptosporidium meleagridis TaxID=93969 RepID=A0A2P4YX49_9CRYT|nr:DHHC palmitoyltransferase family protein [Cryptosporidium meleagridis]
MNGSDNDFNKSKTPCCILEEDLQNEIIRKNGFQKPFVALQILIWALFGLNILAYYTFVIPSLPLLLATIIGIISALLCVIVFTLGWKVTAINPGYSEEDSLFNSSNLNCSECKICHLFFEENSKHCKLCNKCIPRYDHHSTISSIIMETMNNNTYIYWNSRLYFWSPITFYTIGILILAIDIPLLILNGHLFVLHCYLVFRGVTTYEYLTKIVIEDENSKNKPGICCCCNTDDFCRQIVSIDNLVGLELSNIKQLDYEEQSISPARGSFLTK